MINNYDDFILESMILESKLVFSNSLMNILNIMPDSNIKRKILDIISSNSDINLVQNFFDISKDSKEEITFIQDRRAQQILGDQPVKFITNAYVGDSYLTFNKKEDSNGVSKYTNQTIFDALGFDADSVEHITPNEGQVGEVIGETPSRITPGKIYVLFKWSENNMAVLNKKAINPYDDRLDRVWSLTRNPIRVGRAIKSILSTSNISVTEKEVEEFINSYKSSWDIVNNAFLKFDIVNGDDISYWYSSERYEDPGRSTLGNSCMANVDSDFFDIYVENPDVCQLVILYSNNNGKIVDGKWKSNKIKGRAILWKTDQGDMFMDRIYYNYESDAELFKQFAERNGWWCKKSQDSGSDFTAQLGSISKKPIYTVSLSKSKFDHYPYVDTICYINFDDKIMSNKRDDMQGDLCSTGGDYDEI